MITQTQKQVLQNARDLANNIINDYDGLTGYEIKSNLNIIQCMIFDVIEEKESIERGEK